MRTRVQHQGGFQFVPRHPSGFQRGQDRAALGHGTVGVDRRAQFQVGKHFRQELAHGGYATGAANQNDFVDLGGGGCGRVIVVVVVDLGGPSPPPFVIRILLQRRLDDPACRRENGLQGRLKFRLRHRHPHTLDGHRGRLDDRGGIIVAVAAQLLLGGATLLQELRSLVRRGPER